MPKAPERIDLLVRADYLYPMSEGAPVIAGGEVAIRDGRIVHAGAARPSGSWDAGTVVDGAGKAVLPGFVNCHSHAASLVFRSQSDDGAGGAALYTVAFRMEKEVGEAEWADLARLGCADMLRAGITTINDIWYAPNRLAEAVEECGLRASIANKVFDVALENLHRGDYARIPGRGESRLADGVAFARAWHGRAGGRITARIGTHASDTCDAGLHREARAEATRLGIGMHIHTAQSRQEAEFIRAQCGCGPLEYLRDIGLLAPDVVCAHLTFAGDGDLAAVAETGAAYAHCPIIYPRRGVYPRFSEIVARGIPTGFATDWMQNDPFEGMRYALNAVRVIAGDHRALTCREALWRHTMGAARVLGLDGEIGSLEAGKKADLIMLDLDRPHLQPFYGDYPALVYYARASDVVTSVVDGRVVLRDGRLTRLDEASVVAGVKAHLPRWRETLRGLGSTALAPDGPCAC
ncbi:MAG: amidohydrolase family protein [Alphaproteobacteria bacterium]|nr:amidohydrolase family protein [Alphaproteobacteria bacterium]